MVNIWVRNDENMKRMFFYGIPCRVIFTRLAVPYQVCWKDTTEACKLWNSSSSFLWLYTYRCDRHISLHVNLQSVQCSFGGSRFLGPFSHASAHQPTRGCGSIVSFPGMVRGRVPAQNGFRCTLGLKKWIWRWRIWFFFYFAGSLGPSGSLWLRQCGDSENAVQF